MIEVSHIGKSFGTLAVLKDVSFSVADAEVVSIVGASGAGKSTLLQIMGSLLRPDTGTVKIDGTDIFSLSQGKTALFRNRKIGFVFQFHNLLPEFTALENVMIPALIARRPVKEAREQARALLAEMSLSERLDHKPAELSGGEQQRVAVARALVNSPAVLFADEPSGNLDTRTKRELHELFFTLRERHGITIVVVTHDGELAGMSDRSIQMQDGQILL